MTETPRITMLKNNSQIKKNKARNMKYVVIVWKPIPFFEDWSWDFKENGVFFFRNTMGLREVQSGKTMNSHQSSSENTKQIFKTVLKTKNTRFLWLDLARTLKKKNFLSFFHDWKFYSWESREISWENLWVPLQLEPPPANKSPI